MAKETVTMQVGRELDALVAEKVMGWPWRVWHAGKHVGKKYLSSPDMEGWAVAQGAEEIHPDAYSLVPQFSATIASAWDVVNHLQIRGFDVYVNTHGAATCRHPVVVVTDCATTVTVTAITVPLGICLAALRACGVNVEEVPR